MGQSKIFMLLGDPVEGTLSPAIMNAAFRSLGLGHAYVAVRVPEKLLTDAIAGVRVMGVAGINVTIPHKITVMGLLDKLDESAVAAGAVNTIKDAQGKLVGYNTDGAGALKNLEESVGRIRGKRVMLLGAGGAARAVAFSIAKAGAELTIANRTVSRTRELAATIEHKLGVNVGSIPMDRAHLGKAIRDKDILINATSVGMQPNVNKTLVTSGMMHRDLVVYDIVYKPLRTRLLQEAERAEARAVEGLGMLVQQAAMAFEIWTGKRAPVKVMDAAARDELKRRAR